MGFATDCIHAGQQPDPTTGAVTVPIYQTSTYVQEGLGRHKGYEYARTHNLTRRTLERNLAALEGGQDAYAYASGMAAIQAVLTLVKAGQRVVVSDNVYGGTHRLFTKILASYGVEFAFLEASDPEALEAQAGALRPPVDRDPHQPAHEDLRHPGPRGPRPPPGRAPGRGQHVHEPVLPAPARAGGRRGRALHDQVPERALGQRRRGGHGEGPRPRRVAAVRPERGGGDPVALRLLAGPARDEDPAPAHAPARGERVRGRTLPAATTRRCGGSTGPGSPITPGTTCTAARRAASARSSASSWAAWRRPSACWPACACCSLGESLGGVETLISHPATMTHAGYTQEERDSLGITTASCGSASGCEDADDLVADLGPGPGGGVAGETLSSSQAR